MVDFNFVNIDNAKLIGRLLPAWARGRKISLFLQAIASPLVAVHNNFKAWAFEKYLYCKVTSQPAQLNWYLKYKLKKHINNIDDNFRFASGLSETIGCFSSDVWRNNLYWYNGFKWGINLAENYDTLDLDNADKIVIHAPAIKSDINYDTSDYEREIRTYIAPFMTSFKEIIILIENN